MINTVTTAPTIRVIVLIDIPASSKAVTRTKNAQKNTQEARNMPASGPVGDEYENIQDNCKNGVASPAKLNKERAY